jgi:hypothetical protein
MNEKNTANSEVMQEINEIIALVKSKPEDDAQEKNIPKQNLIPSPNKLVITNQELITGLGFLKVSIKYFLFDLEATKRENKHLRELLEQKPREE